MRLEQLMWLQVVPPLLYFLESSRGPPDGLVVQTGSSLGEHLSPRCPHFCHSHPQLQSMGELKTQTAESGQGPQYHLSNPPEGLRWA